MGKEKPVELSLELGEGACRVMLDGLALNITLKSPNGGMPLAAAPTAAAPVPQLTHGNGAESQRLVEELDYYRQISHDIYDELGQLAKKLNLSLQDLTMADMVNCQIDSPGEHLDQARCTVNDVLEMTEKATLNILDLVEQIREDCEAVRHEIISLGPNEEDWGTIGAGPAAPAWGEETKALVAQMLAQGEELNRQFQAQSVAAPPAAVEEVGSSLHFPLAEILQIVLEFCGNEALKQHLKAVIAKQGEIFPTQEVEAEFSKLAATQPVEDGFSQFPVEEILKVLLNNCQDARVKDLFTKMLGSAGKLFPMPVLPLEGTPVEAAAAPPAPAAPEKPAFLPLWEDFFQKVQKLAAQAETPPEVPATTETPVAEDKIQKTTSVLDRITGALSRIMEALAFQDLSGQRLLQVLNLLRQIQLQILTMVVAAGTKLKKKTEQRGITLEESGALAQDEIDRLMVTVTPPASSAEAPSGAVDTQVLDQEAINDLLTNMGF
ncbi:MAG: protein phosphatase CheZ [Desulfobaccales bacterium]